MAHPRQQQVARGVNVLDQRAHALDAVGRNQTLLRENIAQVGVELPGKAFRTGNLGPEPVLLGLADVPTAAPRHSAQQLVLAQREVGDVGRPVAGLEAQSLRFLLTEPVIADLQLQAAELPEREVAKGAERIVARHIGCQIEAHGGGELATP
jgi:hypothetical protein